MTSVSGAAARAAAARAAAMLARDPRVRLVYLFGSAADPSRSTVRDVDLAVLAIPPFSLDELLRLRVEIGRGAGLELDLVSLNRAPVVLAHEVADTGRCLFTRTPDDVVEFVTRARARYWDFEPFRERSQTLARERAEARTRGTQT